MRNLVILCLTSAALLSFFGCSSDSKPAGKVDSGAPLLPTFTNVYGTVIKKGGCTQVQCHGALQAGGLRLDTKAAAYANLVGQKAAGPCIKDAGAPAADGSVPTKPVTTTVCGCGHTGAIRVIPNDPDNSLLVQKLSDTEKCGERMPQTGEPVTLAQLDLVKQWITAGAKDD
jgi:hypothetical protein